MKYAIAMALALVSASQAKADGFVCQTTDGDLNVKVYDHTQASEGTRTAAIMVVSDPAVGNGNSTIAKFTDVKSTLSSQGADYLANVDLRVSESNRGGELIAGTKLMYVDTIELAVDFSFNEPVAAGEQVSGELVIVKRNGAKIHRDVECTRYLKN